MTTKDDTLHHKFTHFGVVRNSRGQSLILALLVMFLLVFIGGLFVSLVARNIGRAQRSGEVLTADYLSEAGIHYVDDQLSYGLDGADWRPMPTFPEVVRLLETGGDPAALLPAQRPDERDPDYMWLMRGFSRFTYGRGRFLVRVTYNPVPGDPMSKYIKIESIGRMGVIDPTDPTTWRYGQPMRSRKEKVAYKAIGITDYARFITNKDRRPGRFALGTQGFVTTFGEQVNPNLILGAPIRVNGDLIWHGRNHVWLDPDRGDNVEVAGDILHGVYSDADPVPVGATNVQVNDFRTEPSSSANFNTIPLPTLTDPIPEVGRYRDGRTGSDVSGLPRGIFRLEPPLLDVKGTGSRLTRYRELTRNSGEWVWNAARSSWINTGYYGWGAGLYIDNRADVQRESSMYTLRSDWTRPGESLYWIGPYYRPPGVTIILTPYDLTDDGRPNLIIEGDSPTFEWHDRDGNPIGTQAVMPYPANGVLFAEGNIRIKGTLPPNTQLTVVSGANIYIEGSILRYPWENYPKGNNEIPLPLDAPRNSAIALLATDNVVVNTTQFFGPATERLMPGNWSTDLASFTISTGLPFFINFAFGADPTVEYPDGVLPQLFVRHTAAEGAYPSYMNLRVNSSDGWLGLYHFNLAWPPGHPAPPPSPANQYIYPLNDFYVWGDLAAEQRWPMWEHQVFTLDSGSPSYNIYTDSGVHNLIGFQLDQNFTAADYLLSRVAVQPCDIRIEALLYAQNGSFFVIPGEWFNPDPDDTQTNFEEPTIARGRKVRGRIDERWPFHGQPLDVRIVIYGAVSENVPAHIADASAWMEKWGWIPINHGSSANTTQAYRPPLDPTNSDDPFRKGLTFIYDGYLSYPKVPNPSHPDDRMMDIPIRYDSFNRPLPILPRLPVSPQTLFFGEPT